MKKKLGYMKESYFFYYLIFEYLCDRKYPCSEKKKKLTIRLDRECYTLTLKFRKKKSKKKIKLEKKIGHLFR